MENMRRIAEKISAGVDLEKNLPEYANKMMQLYNRFSSIKLSMNYCILHPEYERSHNKEKNEIIIGIKKIMSNLISEGVKDESDRLFSEIDSIRKKVKSGMSRLMSYADKFAIYEYVFNRIEYKYRQPPQRVKNMAAMTDEDITRIAIGYIYTYKDQMLINSNISEILRELPIRMTKKRFFELLSDGIGTYKNSTLEKLNNFVYMIESCTLCLNDPEEDCRAEAGFEKFEELERKLKNVSMSNLTKEEYEEYSKLLRNTVEIITGSISDYMIFAEIINDILATALSDNYVLSLTKEREKLTEIFNIVNKKPERYEYETDSIFEELEGVQEELYDEYSKYEYVLDTVRDKLTDTLEGMNLSHIYECLIKIRMLLSEGALFVDLDKKTDNTKLTGEMMKDIIEKLTDKYKAFFERNEKCINRAVMSITLSKLPVFFNDMSELYDYIRNSMSICSEAERIACVELIYMICDPEEGVWFEDE